MANRDKVASHREALDAMLYAAILGNKFNLRPRSCFWILGKFNHMLVGIADADVQDAGSLFRRLRS